MTLPRRLMLLAKEAGVLPSFDVVLNSLPEEEITAVLDGRAYLSAKVAALRAHRSQVDLENGLLATFAKIPEFALEHYVLVRGERGPGSEPYGWEDDLFAGLGDSA